MEKLKCLAETGGSRAPGSTPVPNLSGEMGDRGSRRRVGLAAPAPGDLIQQGHSASVLCLGLVVPTAYTSPCRGWNLAQPAWLTESSSSQESSLEV